MVVNYAVFQSMTKMGCSTVCVCFYECQHMFHIFQQLGLTVRGRSPFKQARGITVMSSENIMSSVYSVIPSYLQACLCHVNRSVLRPSALQFLPLLSLCPSRPPHSLPHYPGTWPPHACVCLHNALPVPLISLFVSNLPLQIM